MKCKPTRVRVTFLLAAIFWHRVDVTSASEVVNVTTPAGQIAGMRETITLPDSNNATVTSFLGIPYAKPPLGDLRFKKPEPVTSLPAFLNATSYGPPCLTINPTKDQDEDCLFLNVFVPAAASPTPATPATPATPSPHPLPVMVWVHGGGFIGGSAASSDGRVLAAENEVIVVTLDYRLGALGFLSTMDDAAPGNAGLWDQHAALSWVKVNVAIFGGDPDSITVFGESAGGKSVSFLATSPHSSPLFQRAIMQSGTVYCPTALQWKPVETATRLGRALDCDVASHDALVDCLRHKPAEQLAELSDKLWDEDPVRKLIDFGWSPVEDRDFVPILYNQDSSPTPLHHFRGDVMLGINNNEGALLKLWRVPEAFRLDPGIEAKLHDREFFTDTFLEAVLAQMFKNLPDNSSSFRAAAEAVSYVYRNWSSTASNVTDRDLYDSFGEQAYMSPTFQYLSHLLPSNASPSSSLSPSSPSTSSSTSSPPPPPSPTSSSLSPSPPPPPSSSAPEQRVYLYVFDHYPLDHEDDVLGGMKHGDDVAYTFGLEKVRFTKMGAAQKVVATETELGKSFRKMLTNFAKTGDPHRPQRVADWPDWPQYSPQDRAYLAISPSPRVNTAFRASKMALWENLVPKLVAQTVGEVGSHVTSNPCGRVSASRSSSSSTAGGAVSVKEPFVWMVVWVAWSFLKERVFSFTE